MPGGKLTWESFGEGTPLEGIVTQLATSITRGLGERTSAKERKV